ncbi:MAG: GNAT family N-acetyltransferase [Oscillospiraceae bacterium]|jgi:GNAT superfamily N-acetyltransferase|nr:GNAT family N-acetyltransferase [Oscillospiraceae bacterium]
MKPTFRVATRADVPAVLGLINELAEYEHLRDFVTTDVATLQHWLFNKHGAEVIVADVDDAVVGYALFFSNFSTFLGKAGLYLEDLYIQPKFRGNGIGKALLVHLAGIAVERDYGRMEWSCLDWNKPSIEFYLSLGAKAQHGWTGYRLEGETLVDVAKKGV